MQPNLIYLRLKSSIYSIIFFSIIVIIVISPIARNELIPQNSQALNYITAILQAKSALFEYQFPLRDTIVQHGLRFPYFQFYSPTTYTVAAILQLLINNPYIILKILIGISLLLGGLFTAKLVELLVESKQIAFITGVAYLTSPYTILNACHFIHLNQSIAIGILPMVIYFSFRFYLSPTRSSGIILTIAWYILSTTHVLTFLCTIPVILFFLVFLSVLNTYSITNLFYFMLILLFSVCLAAWYLAPLFLLANHLQFSSEVVSHYNSSTASLLSLFASTYNILNSFKDGLLPPLGLAFAFGLVISIFSLLKNSFHKAQHTFLILLFLLCLIEIILPIPLLNKYHWNLLSQLNWLGALLYAFALYYLHPKPMSSAFFIFIIFLTIGCSSTWLISGGKAMSSLQQFLKQPTLAMDQTSYLMKVDNNDAVNISGLQKARAIMTVDQTIKHCQQQRASLICDITTAPHIKIIELPFLFYPYMIQATDNGKTIPYFSINRLGYLITAINTSTTIHHITIRFRGIQWANWLSVWSLLILCVLTLSRFFYHVKTR